MVITSGDTNPMTYAQKTARGKRVDIYNPNKITKIINLYFDNFYNADGHINISRDLTKLKLRQKESTSNIIWINDINDIE
jgi:hypothetical protein